MNMKKLKNYHFNWKDQEGMYCGFNDVWAYSKREAIKKIREMESKNMMLAIETMKIGDAEYRRKMTELGNFMAS